MIKRTIKNEDEFPDLFVNVFYTNSIDKNGNPVFLLTNPYLSSESFNGSYNAEIEMDKHGLVMIKIKLRDREDRNDLLTIYIPKEIIK